MKTTITIAAALAAFSVASADLGQSSGPGSVTWFPSDGGNSVPASFMTTGTLSGNLSSSSQSISTDGIGNTFNLFPAVFEAFVNINDNEFVELIFSFTLDSTVDSFTLTEAGLNFDHEGFANYTASYQINADTPVIWDSISDQSGSLTFGSNTPADASITDTFTGVTLNGGDTLAFTYFIENPENNIYNFSFSDDGLTGTTVADNAFISGTTTFLPAPDPVIPEPSTYIAAATALGMGGFLYARKRRTQKAAAQEA